MGPGPVLAKVLPHHISRSVYNLILKRLFYYFLKLSCFLPETLAPAIDCIERVQLTMHMKMPTNTWCFLSSSEPSCMEQSIGPWHVSVFKLMREEKVI